MRPRSAGDWNASGAQVPTLFVVLKEGQDVSRTELRAFCSQAVADYKLPQLLRHVGVLRYAGSLAEKVDSLIELAPGSAEEVEIRANTIWAAELVRQHLARLGVDAASHQIDLLLWLKSKSTDAMKPHHRTRTIYY